MPSHDATSAVAPHFDVTLSFAAGGWFQMYHFGVCKALQESGYLDGLRRDGKTVRYCGSSAGALAAASLAAGCSLHDAMKDFAVICAEHYRESLLHVLCMREYLVAAINRFSDQIMETPEKQERTLAGMNGGQLEIYTTTLPWFRRKCISEFRSLEDIEEALLASCCLSPIVGFPFPLRESGEWVCDGGFRAFQPRKGEPRTITISPFYFSSADIRPSTAVPVWWGLYPPSKDRHELLYSIGYNDAVEYLVTASLVPNTSSTLLKPVRSGGRQGKDLAAVSGVGRVMADLLMMMVYVAILRPLAVAGIYLEMIVVGLALGCVLVVNLARGASNDWRPVYETFRNMVSLRVLLRLLLTNRIPINETRLVQRSRLYRCFQPLVFESGHVRWATPHCSRGHPHPSSAGGTTPGKKKRFVVDAFWSMKRPQWSQPHPPHHVGASEQPTAASEDHNSAPYPNP